MIALIPTSVEDAAAQAILTEYVAYRTAAFPPPGRYRAAMPDPRAFDDPGTFLVATVDGVVSGCGGVRPLSPARFEIKHLFVRPEARGCGVGRAVLGRLRDVARSAGATELVLDTHSSLTAAGALYASSGFELIDAYNDNPNADRWLRAIIDSPVP